MRRCLPCIAALLVPTMVTVASELPTMTLEPVHNPPPGSSSDRLVDRVVPAYGVRNQSPYRMPSRLSEIYNQIRTYTAQVDAMVLSDHLAVADDRYVPATEEGRGGREIPGARPLLVKAELLPQQERLIELIAQLSAYEEDVPLPNHYERWHLNNSYRDLFRAGEHLALSIGDPRFNNLRELHRAWKDHYHMQIQAALVEQIVKILETEQADRRRIDLELAQRQAIDRGVEVPWPTMSLDLEEDPYPAVVLPAIPRWSELNDEIRNRFIERFGIPGQALKPAYPPGTEVPPTEDAPPADEDAPEAEEAPEDAAVEEEDVDEELDSVDEATRADDAEAPAMDEDAGDEDDEVEAEAAPARPAPPPAPDFTEDVDLPDLD